MNTNNSQSLGFSSEDISRINAIDLSDPNSVAAINAINVTGEERNLMRELKEGVDHLALTRKVKELEEENKSLREELAKTKEIEISRTVCAHGTPVELLCSSCWKDWMKQEEDEL